MKTHQYLKHAVSMTKREFFSGANQLTLFALTLSVTIVCALSLTSSRIENAMTSQAADLIGGDRVITSTTPFSEDIIEVTTSFDFEYSNSVTLSSMISTNDNFELSRLRAVDNNYPLKGNLVISDTINSLPEEVQSGPKQGEIWADNKLLSQLNVRIGDVIDVGSLSLTLSKILIQEPDQTGNFYSFFPKALMNINDLDSSNLVQPGSRLRYRLMIAEPVSNTLNSTTLLNWADAIEPLLTPNQRIIDPKNQNNRLSENLKKASTFLNLGGLMAIILSGIAISLAASRHAIKNIPSVALLRCLGLKSYQVNLIYGLQLILIGSLATALGLLIGYGIHTILINLIAALFSGSLPSASIQSWMTGPIVSFLMLLGFALPPIFQLAQTPPGQVLRQDNEKSSLKFSSMGVFAIIGLILIAWWQTKQFLFALVTIISVVIIVGLLLTFITKIFSLLPKDKIKNIHLRNGYASIKSRPWLSAMQIIGFGLSVFTIALVLYFRTDLFNQWQNEVPENAPNRFAFDIQDSQKEGFQRELEKMGLIDNPIFPVVRGRLVEINNAIVQTAISKENPEDSETQDEALSRDLALTQLTQLPYENLLEKGTFYGNLSQWQEDQATLFTDNVYPVSIESELAKNINLSINDRLNFVIEGRNLQAIVTSIRKVNWQNFHPNFYMIFPDGTLDDYAKTWLASFHSNGDQQALAVEQNLSKNFLGITIINVDDILTKIRKILNQVGAAMELISIMTFLAGIAIFWASFLISFDEKQQQTALFRALGANDKTIAKRFMMEHAIIGVLSGLLAFVCLVAISWAVSTFVLDIAWGLSWIKWLLLPVILAALLTVLSRWQLKSVLKTPPLTILR